MTNIVRKPRNEAVFLLEVPRIIGRFEDQIDDGRGEKLYSQLDLDEAVAAAVIRGREQATADSQAYRDDLQRGYERAFDIVEESSRQIHQIRQDTVQGIGVEILELVYRLVERILRVELPQCSETLPRLLDELLVRLSDVGAVIVRVSPPDCQALRKIQGAEPDRWKGFLFRSDPDLEEGGCLVETETGSWDARVETQLAEIYAEVSQVGIEGTAESEAAA